MLTGYANLLNDFPPAVAQAGNVSAENFALWLRRYVYQHTRGALPPCTSAITLHTSYRNKTFIMRLDAARCFQVV